MPDGDFVAAQVDTVASYAVDLGGGDDEGFVDAQEGSGRQLLEVKGERGVGEQHARGEVDFGIAAVGFEEQDVGQVEVMVGFVAFDEEALQGGRVGGRHGSCGRGSRSLHREGIVDGLEEAFEGEGLEEVVGHVELVAFEGEFFVGGGDNDLGRLGQRTQKVEARKAGHVQVEKDKIYLVLAEVSQCFERIVALFCQLQMWKLLRKFADEVVGQGLVVDNEVFDHGAGLSDG